MGLTGTLIRRCGPSVSLGRDLTSGELDGALVFRQIGKKGFRPGFSVGLFQVTSRIGDQEDREFPDFGAPVHPLGRGRGRREMSPAEPRALTEGLEAGIRAQARELFPTLLEGDADGG